jgi:hypothetical protein
MATTGAAGRGVTSSRASWSLLEGVVGRLGGSSSISSSPDVSMRTSGRPGSWGGAGGRAGGGTGLETQSLYLAEWGSLQFGQRGTEAGQQARTGLVFPPLGQEGLGHRWADLVWGPAQKGHVGVGILQRGAGCPKAQQLSHWVLREEEKTLSTEHFFENRTRLVPILLEKVGGRETTTEVANLPSLEAGSGLR